MKKKLSRILAILMLLPLAVPLWLLEKLGILILKVVDRIDESKPSVAYAAWVEKVTKTGE